ncbi:MAG: YitT family protein [Pseudomonadota bacterium]
MAWVNFFKNIFLISLGGAIYVIGVNGILAPQHFLNGGVVGVSLILTYLYPSLDLGLVYALFNIPLFVFGYFRVSRKFILYTGFGIVFYSALTSLVQMAPIPVDHPILAAILAGIICGAGGGIVLRSVGSMGGIDILAVYLLKKYSFRVGLTSFILNALILAAGAFFFNLEMALYSLIFVYTQAKLTDAVLGGFNRRKSIIIISDRSDDIAQAIMFHLNRGVTFLEGQGAYSHRDKKVLLSVIATTELGRFKEILREIDPKAFVIINDAMEVLGLRHGRIRDF